MNRRSKVALTALAAALSAGGLLTKAFQQTAVIGYEDTPMLPGGKWHVHDGKRPQPRIVTPGTFSAQEAPGRPPSDAVVLFDGADLSKWRAEKGGPARWKVENGYMEVVPKSGDILTGEEFGNSQLHVEWRAPDTRKGAGQSRGNSGVYLFGRYEIQVLDSFENITYPDGQAAAVYGQYPPLVNASRRPGQWQVYDILFTAPRFKDGKVETPLYVTVFHNGVVVHHHAAIMGATGHRILPKYVEHGPTGPIRLQDHGAPVRYRNIWIRQLKDYDQP